MKRTDRKLSSLQTAQIAWKSDRITKNSKATPDTGHHSFLWWSRVMQDFIAIVPFYHSNGCRLPGTSRPRGSLEG